MDSLPDECVYSACICCYTSCVKEPLIGCKGKEECLCCSEECCIAANEPQFDIGVIKDDKFFIKLGLPCCTCGIKKVPEWFNPILLGNGQCLCLKQFAAFPPQPLICAVCCIQCVPNMGIFKPPTAGGAPDNSTMQR